jgi:hypothetical protein
MKWNMPWQRKADEAHDYEKDVEEYNKHADTGTSGSSPFVEPFRPLYDIRDDRLNETYQTRPLYTPSTSNSKRSTKSTRITSNYQSFPSKQRTTSRTSFDRSLYRRDRSPYFSRFEEGESYSIIPFQWIGAIFLIGLLYFGFHGTSPIADRIQTAATNAMHTDYNLSKIIAWFQQHSNGSPGKVVPASTPSAGSDSNDSGTVKTTPTVPDSGKSAPSTSSNQVNSATDTGNQAFVKPLPNGKVTSDFKAETQQEMIISGASGSAVQAVAAGQVAAVDNNAQQGTFVLIDHGKYGKTLYGHLGDVTVKVNDKVNAKQTIGHLENSGSTADMYFGYIVNGKYVNPHNIISF